MTVGKSIDYDGLTQQALRNVVRSVLASVAKSGLPGEHHFFVAFDTRAPGVAMSRRLKEKYPEEMMIVLQHRFWDLAVNDDRFEVKLTFDGIPERLVVPFSALKLFFDPSVRFTLQFDDPGSADEATPNTVEGAGEGTFEGKVERLRSGENDEAADASRPVRRQTDRRTRKPGSDPTEDAASVGPAAPLTLPARTERPADPPLPAPALPADPAEEAGLAAESAASEAATAGPAPEPSGAKVVSIDSWRNRK